MSEEEQQQQQEPQEMAAGGTDVVASAPADEDDHPDADADDLTLARTSSSSCDAEEPFIAGVHFALTTTPPTLKTPLVDSPPDASSGQSAAGGGAAASRQYINNTSSAATSSQHATAICEVIESPVGLLRSIYGQGNAAQDPDERRRVSRECNSLYVLIVGNFASADFYIQFVEHLRRRKPDMGVLVLGHAGVQRRDRNGRVEFKMKDLENITAQFLFAAIFNSKRCEEVLSFSTQQEEQENQLQQGEEENDSTKTQQQAAHIQQQQQQQRRRHHHPNVILAAHSVGAAVLTRAVCDQLVCAPGWASHVNLHAMHLYAPVIENFEAAPSGAGARKWVGGAGRGLISYAAVLPFWLLPEAIKKPILKTATGATDDEFVSRLVKILRPSSCWNCLRLVSDAFDTVKNIEETSTCMGLKVGLREKLFFYFAQEDGWVPDAYIEKFREIFTRAHFVIEADGSVSHSCCVTSPRQSAAAFPLDL